MSEWERYRFVVRERETGVVVHRSNLKEAAEEVAAYLHAQDGKGYFVEERP